MLGSLHEGAWEVRHDVMLANDVCTVYVTALFQIVRCDLTGHRCVTAVDNLSPRPEDIKVDPCNG